MTSAPLFGGGTQNTPERSFERTENNASSSSEFLVFSWNPTIAYHYCALKTLEYGKISTTETSLGAAFT